MLHPVQKRLVNGVVLLIAVVAFFLVPVGRRTMSQHLVAIFTTPPARECAAACAEAARKALDRARVEVTELREKNKRSAGLDGRKPEEPELEPAD